LKTELVSEIKEDVFDFLLGYSTQGTPLAQE
jgi:hypothetical protein